MVMGMRELTILDDCLRYSLLPLEKVLFWRVNNPIVWLLIRINRNNDFRRKCLNEFGIKETSYWYLRNIFST